MRRIVTNNVPRDLIEAWELTAKEREQFDYHDWAALDRGEDSAAFFRYKGELYDLGNFMAGMLPGWDGVQADSYFSGVAVRLVDNGERVVVALVFA